MHVVVMMLDCSGYLPTPCQFTGCSFGAAAILQYETLKSRVQSAKDEEEAEKLLQVRFNGDKTADSVRYCQPI